MLYIYTYMAAFLNKSMDNTSDSSDFEVYEEPSWDKEEDISPQTPLKQINVKSMYGYEGQYYDPEEVKKFDKPGISEKLRKKLDKIKEGGLIKVSIDILGRHRPVNLRRKKPPPRGLLPTQRSKMSHKSLMQGLEEADRRPIGSEKRIKKIKKEHKLNLKTITGGKKKTKKRRKRRRTKKRGIRRKSLKKKRTKKRRTRRK
jgi:hypothetical protein